MAARREHDGAVGIVDLYGATLPYVRTDSFGDVVFEWGYEPDSDGGSLCFRPEDLREALRALGVINDPR